MELVKRPSQREITMRKNVIHRFIACGAAVLLFGVAMQAQAQVDNPNKYQEGLHYFLVDQAPPASADRLEVLEAFSYLCSHCNAFEPFISNWEHHRPEDVKFRRLPVVFGRSSWELYARAYVTADLLNIADQSHGAMMDHLWKDKAIMRSMEEIADFYSQYGVDPAKFVATAKSFGVDRMLREDQLKVQSYGVQGTPTLIVNGRYRVAGSAAVPNYDVMLDVVDFLIAKDRAEGATQQGSDTSD
jgi:thiol:disulfide interchange protein DsbA